MAFLTPFRYLSLALLGAKIDPENAPIGSYSDRALCTDITGLWRNQLGSNMTVQHVGHSHRITGRYNTTVESHKGAANISSDISGLVYPVEGGSLVAFNVLWNNGSSLTSWVGQCMVCDGKEQLNTTWVLQSLQQPNNKWMSTIIDQDSFYRVGDLSMDMPHDTYQKGQTPDVSGEWKSPTGDYVKIKQMKKQDIISGTHKAPGAVNGPPVYGRVDGNKTYTALGFVAANANYIKGWSGHIYNPQQANPIMETSWLSHVFSNQCNNPRKHMEVGREMYFKEK